MLWDDLASASDIISALNVLDQTEGARWGNRNIAGMESMARAMLQRIGLGVVSP